MSNDVVCGYKSDSIYSRPALEPLLGVVGNYQGLLFFPPALAQERWLVFKKQKKDRERDGSLFFRDRENDRLYKKKDGRSLENNNPKMLSPIESSTAAIRDECCTFVCWSFCFFIRSESSDPSWESMHFFFFAIHPKLPRAVHYTYNEGGVGWVSRVTVGWERELFLPSSRVRSKRRSGRSSRERALLVVVMGWWWWIKLPPSIKTTAVKEEQQQHGLWCCLASSSSLLAPDLLLLVVVISTAD